MDFNWMNQRNRLDSEFRKNLTNKHPKCLGDGVDGCDYHTKIDCEECKYNNMPYGKKDPNAKCNQT